MTAVRQVKEVFAVILRLASILDRATHLSLQDLREEKSVSLIYLPLVRI
jgi:hypothetical protein